MTVTTSCCWITHTFANYRKNLALHCLLYVHKCELCNGHEKVHTLQLWILLVLETGWLILCWARQDKRHCRLHGIILLCIANCKIRGRETLRTRRRSPLNLTTVINPLSTPRCRWTRYCIPCPKQAVIISSKQKQNSQSTCSSSCTSGPRPSVWSWNRPARVACFVT